MKSLALGWQDKNGRAPWNRPCGRRGDPVDFPTVQRGVGWQSRVGSRDPDEKRGLVDLVGI